MDTRFLNAISPDESHLPPSRRTWARLVQLGAAEVMELRDPNDGQGTDPQAKSRHQYVRAGGSLWRRRLPPETVGDEWIDAPGPVPWDPMERPPDGPLRDYYDQAQDLRVLVVRRQAMQAAGETVYEVRGETVSADEVDDVEVLAGPVLGAWWEVPLTGLCPDCGGDLVWWEAGYVPGTRKCLGHPVSYSDQGPRYDTDGGCGSLFAVR